MPISIVKVFANIQMENPLMNKIKRIKDSSKNTNSI